MKRKYPFRLFLLMVVLNFTIRHFYFFLPGVLLALIGIGSPTCKAIGTTIATGYYYTGAITNKVSVVSAGNNDKGPVTLRLHKTAYVDRTIGHRGANRSQIPQLMQYAILV